MSKKIKIFFGSLLGMGLVIALFFIIYPPRELIRRYIIHEVERYGKGKINIAEAGGDLFSNLILTQANFISPDKNISFEKIEIKFYFWDVLLRKKIKEIKISNPSIIISKKQPGIKGFPAVFQQFLISDNSKDKSVLPIKIDQIKIDHGALVFKTAENEDGYLEKFSGINLVAGLNYDANQLKIIIKQLDFVSLKPNLNVQIKDGVLDLEGKDIFIEQLDIFTAQARMSFSGRIKDVFHPHLKIKVDFNTEDIAFLKNIDPIFIELPLKGNFQASFYAEGTLADLSTKLEIKSAEFNLVSTGKVDLSQGENSAYDLNLKVNNFDINKFVLVKEYESDLNLIFNLKGKGLNLDALSFQCSGLALPSQFKFRKINSAVYDFTYDKKIFNFKKLDLETDKEKIAGGHGEIIFVNTNNKIVPQYSFAGFFYKINLTNYLENKQLSTDLNFFAQIKGQGLILDELEINYNLSFSSSEIDRIFLKKADLQGNFNRKKISVDKFSLISSGLSADIKGEVLFNPEKIMESELDLEYRLEAESVRELDNWANFFPLVQSIDLNGILVGKIKGKYLVPEFSGTFDLKKIRYKDILGEETKGSFYLKDIFRSPEKNLLAEIHQIKFKDKKIEKVKFESVTDSEGIWGIRLNVFENEDREYYLEGLADFKPVMAKINLKNIAMITKADQENPWKNLKPVNFYFNSERIIIESFDLGNTKNHFSLQGDLNFEGRGNLLLNIEQLILEDFVKTAYPLKGILSGKLSLKGDINYPLIDGYTEISQVKMGNLEFDKIISQVNYARPDFSFGLNIYLSDQESIFLKGTFPLFWDFADIEKLKNKEELLNLIFSEKFVSPLKLEAKIKALKLSRARQIIKELKIDEQFLSDEGTLSLVLAVNGTMEEPLVNGSVIIEDSRINDLAIKSFEGNFEYIEKKIGLSFKLLRDAQAALTCNGGVTTRELNLKKILKNISADKVKKDFFRDLNLSLQGEGFEFFQTEPVKGIKSFKGVLSFQAMILGGLSDPKIEGNFNLQKIIINLGLGENQFGVNEKIRLKTLSDLNLKGDFNYQNEKVNIVTVLSNGSSQLFFLKGFVPLNLLNVAHNEINKSPQLVFQTKNNEINLQGLTSRNFNLSSIIILTEELRNLKGEISGEIFLQGPINEPVFLAKIKLIGGSVFIPAINIEYKKINGNISIKKEQLKIDELSIETPEGVMNLAGDIELKNFKPENINLRLYSERFKFIDIPDLRIISKVDLNLSGDLKKQFINGNIILVDSYIDISQIIRPTEGEIIVIKANEEKDLSNLNKGEDKSFFALFPLLMFDFKIFSANTAVKIEDAHAEVKEELRIIKDERGIRIGGEVITTKGEYEFRTKKFDLEEGKITFNLEQEKINPQLHFVARHNLPQATVWAIVGGTVREPKFNFRSDPAMVEEDIISFLVFGKPLTNLSKEEEQTLGNKASEVFGFIVADRMQDLLEERLRFDTLNIEGGNEKKNPNPKVSIGKYLTKDIFLSYGYRYGDIQSEKEVSIEYKFSDLLSLKSNLNNQNTSGVDMFLNLEH